MPAKPPLALATAKTPGHARDSSPAPQTGSAEQLLWQRWKLGRDLSARAALVDNHSAFARMLAASVFSARIHDEVGFDDYFQLAMLGLLQAIDRFLPERGSDFRAYASRRIRGSMLSGIEKLTEKNQQAAARRDLRKQRLGVVA